MTLVPSDIQVLDDETINDVRTLRLRVRSQRETHLTCLYLGPENEAKLVGVNGKAIEPVSGEKLEYRGPAPAPQGNPWALYYYGLPPEE